MMPNTSSNISPGHPLERMYATFQHQSGHGVLIKSVQRAIPQSFRPSSFPSSMRRPRNDNASHSRLMAEHLENKPYGVGHSASGDPGSR